MWTRQVPAFVLSLCALSFCWVNFARAEEKQEQVTVNDVNRTFLVHLPKGYNAKQRYPVVLLLPGRDQNADDMANLSRFNEVADRHGIIAVYPNALHGLWNIGVSTQQPSSGHAGGYGHRGGGGLVGLAISGIESGVTRRGGGQPSEGGERRQSSTQADDIAFFNSMLDKLSSSYSVDNSRIYATGLSDGGLMNFQLGCRLSNRIVAIAPVGAEMPRSMVCAPPRALPVLMINGTSDPVMPYSGESGKAGSYATLSAQDSAKTWAVIDQCGAKAQRTESGKHIQVETYSCNPNAEVVLYSLKSAGNTWPGGEQYLPEKQIGKTATDLNASEVIWKFFSAYAIPAPIPPLN